MIRLSDGLGKGGDELRSNQGTVVLILIRVYSKLDISAQALEFGWNQEHGS